MLGHDRNRAMVEVSAERISVSPFAIFDEQWYRLSNPDIPAGCQSFEHYLSEGWWRLRSPHPLFSIDYYLQQRPDVRAAGVEPLRHFVTSGWKEGSDPHPLFSVNWYLTENPDVAEEGINPLVHYLVWGGDEGRNPHPLFETRWYLAQCPAGRDVGNPLVHYLLHGYRQGLDPHPSFQNREYFSTNVDLDPENVNPLLHYETTGWKEARDPTCWFSTRHYLCENPAVRSFRFSPFVHYLVEGRASGLLPCPPDFEAPLYETVETIGAFRELCAAASWAPENGSMPFHEQFGLVHRRLLDELSLFDGEFYKLKYLSNSPIDPLSHYLAIGWRGGLCPNEFFDPEEYLKLNPELRGHVLNPVIHYALYGWRQGRIIGSLFNGNQYLVANRDVAAADICPLSHYLAFGRAELRDPLPTSTSSRNIHSKKKGLSGSGTILLVTHDMGVGGAQAIVRTIAKWLIDSTGYDVKIVAIRGGGHQFLFEQVALIFNLEEALNRGDRTTALKELQRFAGREVRGILVNSIASYSFFEIWDQPTPAAAYIHELSKMISAYADGLDILKKNVRAFFAGSEAVKSVLCGEFGVESEKCHVIYDFINDAPFLHRDPCERRVEFKEAIDADVDKLLVVGCGTVNWRKSPDIFIEVARQSIESGLNANFVWVGSGPDEKACKDSIESLGLAGRVRFVGYQEDVSRWIGAADIFLLPSEEDPFPLVCLLAAAASIPIICFQDAGGVPEFTKLGSGVAVPFKDADAMFRALRAYTENPELREETGRKGNELVESKFTVRMAGPEILHQMRQIMGTKPALTVIVPNYNYEKYLPERLRSIYRQTFQDFEVVLLDDASQDGSVALLDRWAASRSNTRLIVNSSNSGSVFLQWKKGISLASADRVWIAEADDFCEIDFLEKALAMMQDPNVFLVYGRSIPTDENGNVAGDYNEIYLNRISPGRWDRSYLSTDAEEISNALGLANCIPNASSVIVKKFELDERLSQTLSAMRLCGDWLFYILSAKGGYVAYVHEAVNYHRRHGSTVTKKMEGSDKYFTELAAVRQIIDASYSLPDKARTQARVFLNQDLERFSIEPSRRHQILQEFGFSDRGGVQHPSLLVVASDLSPGGGQMFAIRLANAWARCGGRSFLLNARYSPDHDSVVSQLDGHVALFNADAPDFNFVDLVEKFQIDVIHSSIWWADKLVANNIANLPDQVAWIVTMHGCYETLLKHPEVDASFEKTLQFMLDRVDHWVFTAEKNKAVFEKYRFPRRLSKVNNGFSAAKITPLDRKSIGLRDGAFVLCLASRAIEEKGWYQAILAAEILNRKGRLVDLLLIGEGPVAEELKKAGVPSFVHVIDQVGNLQDYINIADIGLVPTYFVGESMPLVLIEFLAQGKPVIGADVGEIKSMLTTAGGRTAGKVIPLQSGKVVAANLAEAIEALTNPVVKQLAGKDALGIYAERFSMETMLRSYSAIYDAALQARAQKRRGSELGREDAAIQESFDLRDLGAI